MPFNGAGTFTLVTGNPVVTGTVISSTIHNNTNNDFASGLTNCVTRDGQSAPSGNLPMGGFKHTGAADATANGQYLTYGQGVRLDQLADTSSASNGDALVGQLDSVTGAVASTWHAYLNLKVKGLKKTFGATGNGVAADDTAFAAALASGKIIEAEEGTYVITSAKTYNTSGYGRGLQLYGWGIEKTKFDNRVASNPMLSISGAGTPSQYAYALQLKNFQIFTTTSPIASIGLKLRSQWGGVIEQVKVNGLTSHGIQIQNDDGDPDASAFLTLDQVFLMSNGGWGLHCVDPVTLACATGDVKLLQSYITGNALGGVRALGIQWLLEHTTFAQNLAGGGLVVPFVAAPSTTMAHLNVFGCDFDDNANYHIDVQACKQGEVAQTKFIYRANGVGMRIGDSGSGVVTNFEARGNTHQRQAGTITAHSIGSNASYTRILGSYYPALTGVTQVSDSGTGTEVEQDGMWVKSAVKTTTTTTSGSYTPDLANGTYHRIVVNATGAFTVNAPTGASDGRELELNLFNASGGAITVTLDAAFAHAGFTNPASTKQKTARFRYHADAGAWVLIGAWSADI
jgi:hypothetical protein